MSPLFLHFGFMMNSLSSFFRMLSSPRRGFSLSETIVALLILSIALLAMAAVPVMSSKLALQTARREQAMSLAVRALDYLESVGPDVNVSSLDVAKGAFSLTYLKPVYTLAGSDDYKAEVTVRWDGVTGQSELVLERKLSGFSNETRYRLKE